MRIAAIMRHAEPEDSGNERSVHHGRNRGLTDHGRRQCEAARAWLTGLEPTCVISSDSPRAIQTAELVGAPLRPRVVPELAGLRLGAWEEEPLSSVRDRVCRVIAGEIAPPRGAESIGAFAERVRSAFRGSLPTEGNVLIVAHRVVNAVLLAEHLGLEPEDALRIPQDHAAVSLLALEDTRDQVLTLNLTPLTPLRLQVAAVEEL
jgi:broad specificity phosphatase PhoE